MKPMVNKRSKVSTDRMVLVVILRRFSQSLFYFTARICATLSLSAARSSVKQVFFEFWNFQAENLFNKLKIM